MTFSERITLAMTQRELRRDPALASKVALCQQVLQELSDAFGISLRFYGLCPGVTAYVLLPSGRVMVGSGLLARVSEGTLRFVLAHEAAHVWVFQHLARAPGTVIPRGHRYGSPALGIGLLTMASSGLAASPLLLGVCKGITLTAAGYAIWDVSHTTGALWHEVQADWGAACWCGPEQAQQAMAELSVFFSSRSFQQRRSYLQALAVAQAEGRTGEITLKKRTLAIYEPDRGTA